MSEPAAKQRQILNLDEFERRLGRPASPAKSGEDPLAELARLVGNTEDRFNSLPARAVMPRTEPRFAAERPALRIGQVRKLGGDFAAIEAGLRGAIAPEFRFVPEPEPEVLPQAAPEAEDWLDSSDAPATDYRPAADYAPAAEEVLEPPRSRLPIYATVAVIVLGMAGIGTSFMLKRHTATPHEIAMIKAAPGPTKIRASDSADNSKPNQDVSLLDKSPQPVPTAVVNRTEEPVDLGPAPQAAPAQNPPAQAEGGAAVVPIPPPPAVEAASAQSFGLSGMIEPKKVKTVNVRPDGTIVSNDTPPPQNPAGDMPQQNPAGLSPVMPSVAPAESGPAAPASQRSADAATPPRRVDARGDADATQDDGRGAHRASKAKPVKLAEANAEVTDAAPSKAASFDVQLAAPATEADARHAMVRLQRQYGSELAGHRLKYHFASVGNKSVYRVRVVGLSHEEATALCQKLQAKGGSCFVAKD